MVEVIMISDYRILTAPVLKPGVPDCDFKNGETPLTTEQIAHLMTTYNNDYNIIDYDHKYLFDGPWYKRNLGTPIRSWQSTEDITYLDVFDVKQTAPAGSWWLQSKVTDPEAIQKIDELEVNSYSLTTANKSFAERFMELGGLSSKNSYDSEVEELLKEYGMISTKHRTLIKDISDPVGFTVSLTGFPCVGGACFAKKCLTQSQNRGSIGSGGVDEEILTSNKHGSDKMTEETTSNEMKQGMSIEDIKSLFSWFTSIKADEKEEAPVDDKKEEEAPKEEEEAEYVTQDQLNKAFEENNKKLINEVSKIIDEKLKEKDEEKDDDKPEEEKEETADDKKGEGEVSNKNNTDTTEEEVDVSVKHEGQSQQIPDPDPQDQISNKHENETNKILDNLGRDALGNTKIRL